MDELKNYNQNIFESISMNTVKSQQNSIVGKYGKCLGKFLWCT